MKPSRFRSMSRKFWCRSGLIVGVNILAASCACADETEKTNSAAPRKNAFLNIDIPFLTGDGILRLVIVLDQPGDGNNFLAFRDLEQRDALRRAPGEADAGNRNADELPAVGHQHDLVFVGDGERAGNRT